MSISQRKTDHLDLCATDQVAFRGRTTLLECVRLMHRSLPELQVDDVDLGVTVAGKRLRAPIVIAGMTGGTERAGAVNQGLARVAEARGYGFGLGSQRAMVRDGGVTATYRVRDVAPNTLVLGNVGVVQAREMETAALETMVREVGADALCLHMNPAMEVIQREGDRDFRGGLATFERAVKELSVPVFAKETGSGVNEEVARALVGIGVGAIDVSGAGGTSWVGVEALRADGETAALGEKFWDWGIPTAASIVYAKRAGATVIATGGISDGLDMARAIALGATACGVARRAYQAFLEGRIEPFFDAVERELRTAMLLVGARRVTDLQRTRTVVTGELRDWLSA